MKHDFKNMKHVQKQINTDKRITLIVSVLGIIIGAGAFIFSITVLFNTIN